MYWRLLQPSGQWWSTSTQKDKFKYDAPVITDTNLPYGFYSLMYGDGLDWKVMYGIGGTANSEVYRIQSAGYPAFNDVGAIGAPGKYKDWTAARLVTYGSHIPVGYASGGIALSAEETVGGVPTESVLAVQYHISYVGAGNVEPPPGDDEHSWTPPESTCGMPRFSVDELHAALVLTDTPLSYEPGFGPAMDFTAFYQQLDPLPARQTTAGPAGFSHLGPGWSCNWLFLCLRHAGHEQFRRFDLPGL